MTDFAAEIPGRSAPLAKAWRVPLLPLAACFYVAVFCQIYALYLFPTFAYAHLNMELRSSSEGALMFFLAVAPVAAYVKRNLTGSFITALIYTLCYVPCIVVVHYSVQRPYDEIIVLNCSFAICMCGLFLVGGIGPSSRFARIVTTSQMQKMFWVTVAMTLAIALAYRQSMRLVSFADVYDLRFENRDQGNAFIGYVTMWSSYCFLPFVLARGMLYREKVNLLLGIAGCVVIYAATGAKSVILTPIFVLGFYVLTAIKRDFFLVLLFFVSVISLGVVFLPDGGAMGFVKSLLFMRTLGTPGWTASLYYEFFSTHPQTHMSHVSVLNAITGSYPYGSVNLGQLIGLVVSGNTDANFNAGFWISDGIAAFGVIGLYFATALVGAYIVLLNYVTAGYDTRFINLWVCGFAMSLLNIPFFTTMLSGGGAMVVLIALAFRVRSASVTH